jgi:hypothetical protein
VGQVYPLFPGPLRLSCVLRYARPVWFASPYRTLVQHIPVSYTTQHIPVRSKVICISVQTSVPDLESK